MKRFALTCAFALCAMPLLLSLAQAEHPTKSESAWFDFENCEFCKNLMEDPGLLEHSTWENHPIKNGSINIITVDPAYAESMATAEKKMNELGMKIQAGEVNPMTLTMCQSCQTFGMLMMGGVNMERVEGDAAIITLLTSDDPSVVTRLHEMAQRNTEELAKMMESHAGHSHN